MASADFLKLTMPMINGTVVHFDEVMRRYLHHSNKDIDPTRSHLNETYGANNWQEVLQKCITFITDMDEKNPPLRRQKDDVRVVADYLYIPCPQELTNKGLSKDFFDNAYSWTNEFFDGIVAGGQVHRDEVHTYIDHGKEVTSLEHMHVLLPAYARWNDKKHGLREGINGKNFNSPDMYQAFQDMLQRNVLDRYGISYQTGKAPRKKSVEELKQEPMMDVFRQLPNAKKELSTAQKELEKAKNSRKDEEARLSELQAKNNALANKINLDIQSLKEEEKERLEAMEKFIEEKGLMDEFEEFYERIYDDQYEH